MNDIVDNTQNAPATENTGDAGASQDSSVEDIAAKFYGNDSETKDAAPGNSEEGNDATKEGADGEQKPADEAKESGDEKEKSDESKDGEESKEGEAKAPDYETVNLPQDLPEGVEIDNDLWAEAKQIAGEHDVPPEAMQKLVDVYSKRIADSTQTQQDQWAEIERGWQETAKVDKEIGGDAYDGKLDQAIRAVKMFGTPELTQALEQTRMGNHPEMIRVFARIGEKISEGGKFDSGSGAGQRTAGDVLFDNSNHN